MSNNIVLDFEKKFPVLAIGVVLVRIVLENIYNFIKLPLQFLYAWMTFGSFVNTSGSFNVDYLNYILIAVFSPVLFPVMWILSLPQMVFNLLNVMIRRLFHTVLTVVIFPVLQTYINFSNPKSSVTLHALDAGDYFNNYGKNYSLFLGQSDTSRKVDIEFSSDYFEIFTVGYHKDKGASNCELLDNSISVGGYY